MIRLILCFFLGVGALRAQQGYLFKKNSIPSHYFLVPTGFELDKDHSKGLYRNGALLLQQLYYEYPRGFYAGLGFVPTFVLGSGQFVPTWIMAGKTWKMRDPRHRLQFNALLIDQPDDNEISVYNLNYTLGNVDKNVSFGAGFGVGNKDIDDEGVRKNWLIPGFTLRGLLRLTPRLWVLSENYIVLTEDGALPLSMTGMRWSKSKFALDFAFLYGLIPTRTLEEGRRQVLGPWLSFQFAFAKRQR